jgi:DNA primase
MKVEDIYPITTIRYPDGGEQKVILHKHLKEYTPPVKYPSLLHQLRGQTMTDDGVYPSDVERWLNGKEVND